MKSLLALTILLSLSLHAKEKKVLVKYQDSFSKECPADVAYPDLFTEATDLKKMKEIITARLKKLGLEVEMQSSPWYTRYIAKTRIVGLYDHRSKWKEFQNKREDLVRLKRLANIIIPSLEKYPPSMFERIKLKKIFLVKDLVIVAAGQMRKAMPDPNIYSIYYGENNDLVCHAGMEERVHHELFHFIEAVVNNDMFYKDPNWLKLNPEKFKYDTSPIKAYLSPDFQNLGHPRPGFVSAYSMDSIYEDKAEVFAWMMTPGYSERLAEWCKTDDLLRNKKSYLQKSFHGSIDSNMDENFFTQFSISTLKKREVEVEEVTPKKPDTTDSTSR